MTAAAWRRNRNEPTGKGRDRATVLADLVKENEFTKTLIAEAKLRGWMVNHARPAWSRDGKRAMTPIQGHGGAPDLLLAHGEFGLFVAELKAGVSWGWQPGQREWLRAAGGFLWHPRYSAGVSAFLLGGVVDDVWLVGVDD